LVFLALLPEDAGVDAKKHIGILAPVNRGGGIDVTKIIGILIPVK
jgi:hypothetical protein